MNLKEIINRPDSQDFTVEELQYVVESYIKAKLGITVQINIYRGLGPSLFLRNRIADQLIKLNQAFVVAQNYFKESKL